MFVRGSYVDPGGYLDVAGYYGYYWSSVSGDSDYAYYLTFNPGGVDPSSSYYRYYGLSVRCAALGG